MRSKVVFPQPEGPTIVTNSPSAMSSVTSASARIREPARVWYVFSRRETAINGALIPGMVRRGARSRKRPLRVDARELGSACLDAYRLGRPWPPGPSHFVEVTLTRAPIAAAIR